MRQPESAQWILKIFKKKADADSKDIRWKIAIYDAAEYNDPDGNPEELTSVEKWESEIASEYLEMYAE